MPETAAGTYANLAGTEIVNNSRVLSYLKNGLGPGSITVYGDCSCENMFDLIGCFPDEVELDQYVDLPGVAGNYISTPDTPQNSLASAEYGLRSNGVASNEASTPDSPVLSITGDIDIQAEITMDNWIPPFRSTIAMKYVAGGNQRSWRFVVNTSGRLELAISPDGTSGALVTVSSDNPTGFAPGSKHWLRVTWRQSDGRVQFFTSNDGINWIQNGTDEVIAVASIFDGTAPIEVGAASNEPLSGIVHQVQIRDGINGILVANPDFTQAPWQSGDVAPTANADSLGNVWTLNGLANIRPVNEVRSARLTGAAGTYISTPDNAALDITGDIDVRVKVALDDWTPGSLNTFLGKYNGAGNQRAYWFYINTTGNLVFQWSTNGTAPFAAASTAPVTAANGSIKWIRSVLDVDNGAAGNDVLFYTSDDGENWVQLGTTVTQVGVTSIFNSSVGLEIGSRDLGATDRLTGNVFYAEIRNGINGTVVANPNFTDWLTTDVSPQARTDGAGRTWTLNGATTIQRTYVSDLDIRVKLSMDDWTPSTTTAIVDKRSMDSAYQLRLETSGILTFSMSANNTVVSFANTGVSLGFIDGSIHWIRVTQEVETGTTTFYTSVDGVTWTVIATGSSDSRWGFYDGISPLLVGAAGASFPLAGSIYYAEVRNGIEETGNSTIVAQFDANATPATSINTPNIVPDEATGANWTINGALWEWGNGAYTFPYYPFLGPTEYVSPAEDGAPWYSEDIPESADFLGFFVDEFTGMDSPFTREVRQSITNGGILTRSRLQHREMVWRGYLFGATCCAVQYGLRWLTRTLSRFGTNCRDCFGDDLEIMVCCPETNSPAQAFRTLKGVGLLEGPTVESERATCGARCGLNGGGCSSGCIMEVEFTLAATQPYFYQNPIPVYECVPLTDLDTESLADVPPFPSCAPVSCSTVLAEMCSPELPPDPVYENICMNPVTGQLGLSQYFTVPNTLWPFLSEVVPVITITNNSGFTYDGIKLGFYTSINGDPCGELFTNPPGCAALCDELTIGYIPGQSSFYIDGRTRRMSVICFNNNTAFPGEKHTVGPWSWPVFSDFGFCMEVQTTTDSPITGDICISLSLVPRTF